MTSKTHLIKLLTLKRHILTGSALLLFVGLLVVLPATSLQSNLQIEASGMANLEAENGTITGNVTEVNDANASGGKYLVLGTAPTATPSPTPTSSPTPTPSPTPAGYVVNLTDFGGVCNGTTNNRQAFINAFANLTAQGGGTLMIPAGDCKVVQPSSSAIQLGSNITVRGASTSSRIMLSSADPASYDYLFHITGQNIALENITLQRSTAGNGIMLNLTSGVNTLRLTQVIVDGQHSAFGGDFHGIMFANTGTYQNINILQSTFRDLHFALLQTNDATTTVRDVTVDGSTFTGNYGDDLEFNAPNAVMSNITVKNSTFTNNRFHDLAAWAGKGVGFANVQTGLIQNNTFDGYYLDPVHIEDRSSNITVDNNSFKNSFTAPLNFASHVFIVDRSHDIRITNNTFDTAANTNYIDCVYMSQGGGAGIPYNITVTGNTFKLRPNTNTVGNYGANNVTVSNNTIINIP